MIVNKPVPVTLQAVGGSNDTIGGEVRVPLQIAEGGALGSGSLRFHLLYDISNVQFGGFYTPAGVRVDDPGLDSGGNTSITLDSTLIANRQILGYALFHVYPVTDSCTLVTFSDIALSPLPKQCVILDGNSASATICSPIRCGTPVISTFMRDGTLPVWSVKEVDAHHLNVNYSKLPEDGMLTIYDLLGREILRTTLPAATAGTAEFCVESSNGRYFAVLSLMSGWRQTRGVLIGK